MKKIVLVDGNSLMFRSYYATAYTGNLMQNKQGIYTNAVFGFCNMMQKLQEEEKTHLFVAFDTAHKTFRHDAFAGYKATRKELPNELLMQIPYIKRYLDVLNISRLEMEGFEADDLLATMATLAKDNGFEEIKIITGDKDLLQLVDDRVSVYITRKGATDLEAFTSDNFYEKMEITPLQIPDYKGLVGDASDNLPGMKGIGQKTATKLLNQFPTLEVMIEHVDEITGKTKEIIQNEQATGLACKTLATVKRDVLMTVALEDTIVKPFNPQDVVQFYQELEFESFIKRLNIKQNDQFSSDYQVIDDTSFDFSLLNDAYLSCEVFGNNYYTGTFLGIGIVDETHQYFITATALLNNPSLQAYLNDPSKRKYTFDVKKLYVVLFKNGLDGSNIIFDLMLASYILNPNQASDDFKKVADLFCTNALNYDEVIYGSKSKAKIPDVAVYAQHAIQKALVLKQITNDILKRLAQSKQEELFQMELNLSRVLATMEINGLKMDKKRLESIGDHFKQTQETIANEIYALAGESFNIQSVKQLGEILFDKLGLPSGKKNKTGLSTNVDVLEKLAVNYPIAKKILEYRTYSKLISTYINGLLDVTNEEDMIHPLYKQALTVTGRLSSIEPNIQNMPIRTEVGQVIREAFISRFSQGLILSCDYSQIELRVLAHLSGDETMIKLFNERVDFHRQTASQMYDVALDEVTKEMRRAAKAINFGIIYGMSAWGLSEAIDVSPLEANLYINKYFDTFKRVKSFLDETIVEAKRLGYTKTLFNRVRYIPEINSPNKALSAFGERTAMNSPIQGSAADIIKMAMVQLMHEMTGMRSKLIAQVHDELVFDVFPKELDALQVMVKRVMENVVDLRVPLVVDINHGENWLKT